MKGERMTEHRKTGLVMDESGNYHIVVTDPSVVDIHNEKEVIALFLKENMEYGECEVFAES